MAAPKLRKRRAPLSPGTHASMFTHTATPILRVANLCKRFDKMAVDGLDLVIRPGEFYALLGPNGAGKTTSLRMIAGLLRPDSGTIEICGVDALADPVGAKRLTAWLPDEPMLYDKLDPLEYLEFVAGLWGMAPEAAEPAAIDLLQRLGLWEHRRQRCEGFSRGMKQKVALAGALIHAPRLLMLDEPLTGLDAAAARTVKDILTERCKAGVAIVLTTHILEVAERLAHRIGIIGGGRLLADGTLEDLRTLAGRGHSTLEEVFLDVTRPGAATAGLDTAA